MLPEPAKYLQDMLDSAIRVQQYTAGKTLSDYLAMPELRDAVHWNFSVIGEALSQLSKSFPAIAVRISEWKRIIAFRNQLIHGYGVIQPGITWSIIEGKLPILIAELRAMLAE